jgi:uncharacterized short protein YbdD (DUF466 family)
MRSLARGWGALTWWIKGVLGEDAYQRYLDHHRRSGCTQPVLTEREFWRARSDRMDRDLQNRCC